MTYLGRFLTYFAAIFLLPLGLHAAWWTAHAHPASYMDADWSSAGVLPAASSVHEATVHVLAGRTGRWKGIFAHHTWVVVKPKGGRYTRYDVVGWGRPVRIDAYAPDGRWFGDTPQIVAVLKGEAAERAIPKIRDTVARYPFSAQGSYVVWPGPNSNTFAAAIARAVPELAAGLLPTAIGKDYAGPLLYAELAQPHRVSDLAAGPYGRQHWLGRGRRAQYARVGRRHRYAASGFEDCRLGPRRPACLIEEFSVDNSCGQCTAVAAQH